MSELNDQQKAIIGKWELESSENFDEFLKELGLNFAIRALAKNLKSTAILSVEGDEWTIRVETIIRSESVTFRMGQQFEHKTPIGVTILCFVEMDETGRLNEIQEIKDGRNKGQKCYIIRYIEDDKMVTLMKTNNVEAKRVFVRVK